MTHDSPPAADTTSHSPTGTSFTDTSYTSHDTWADTSTSTSHHDSSHNDQGSHHHHHHHHQTDPDDVTGTPTLPLTYQIYQPPTYGSIVTERDSREGNPTQEEEPGIAEVLLYLIKGIGIIASFCFLGYVFGTLVGLRSTPFGVADAERLMWSED